MRTKTKRGEDLLEKALGDTIKSFLKIQFDDEINPPPPPSLFIYGLSKLLSKENILIGVPLFDKSHLIFTNKRRNDGTKLKGHDLGNGFAEKIT